ncbi:MAG: DUF106 domain-containing protein [Candidatus Aenigmarchaeota archaeon]|nr:DUF106 domain-containing protein [Candidatus Aenigmarchaeota archaeon]
MGIIPSITSPALDIFVFSMFIAIVLSLLQKLLVNQEDAKRVKERMKALNEEMKSKRDTGEHAKIMESYMKENSTLMSMTMKPSLVSLALFLLVFIPALSYPYGDHAALLENGQGNVSLGAGYAVAYAAGKASFGGMDCELPCEKDIDGVLWEIRHETSGLPFTAQEEKIVFSRIIARLPFDLPLAGSSVSWVGWYILSLLMWLSILRKALKIHL